MLTKNENRLLHSHNISDIIIGFTLLGQRDISFKELVDLTANIEFRTKFYFTYKSAFFRTYMAQSRGILITLLPRENFKEYIYFEI